MTPAECAIAVMGKASRAGFTKTRLCPPLNHAQAADFNTAFLQDIVGNLAVAAESVDLTAYIAYGPAGSQQFFREQLPAVGLIESSLPNFGDCLLLALDALFAQGHATAGVINADSPTLPTGYLRRAVRALAAPGDRVVLGPSTDGGYYFLGVKQRHPRLFQEIDWSTGHVARQTLERAAEIHVETVLLDAWYDVDDAAALRLLHGEIFGGVAPPFATGCRGYDAPQTRRLLLRLLGEGDLGSRLGIVQPAVACAGS